MNIPTRELRLYNTLSRQIETVTSFKPGQIGLYCCGPTVYNFQHIGNLKTYLCEDVLLRALRLSGYEVNHVMNITDVGHLAGDDHDETGEDKMLLAMRREQKNSHEIAQFYTDTFFHDCGLLNITRPNIVCKATEHIPEMIALIKRLEENGHAYFSNGNVYFDVSKRPDYGKLAGLNLEQLQAGARIEIDPNKRNPHDFVLWFTNSKFKDQELQWDSPWGFGYPGWHIECTAMSMKYLGERFDIHCGGIDHIPVHHSNEIAQAEGAIGGPWVPHWFHSEHLLINAEKMAKSKGGFLTLKDLVEHGTDPLAFRLLVLGASYRRQLNFTWEALDSANNALRKMRQLTGKLKAATGNKETINESGQKYIEEFWAAICDDLNTARALAVLWKLLGDESLSPGEIITVVTKLDSVLGLDLTTQDAVKSEIPAEITGYAQARDLARQQKDWAEADRLRDLITAAGYEIQDSAEGTQVTQK